MSDQRSILCHQDDLTTLLNIPELVCAAEKSRFSNECCEKYICASKDSSQSTRKIYILCTNISNKSSNTNLLQYIIVMRPVTIHDPDLSFYKLVVIRVIEHAADEVTVTLMVFPWVPKLVREWHATEIPLMNDIIITLWFNPPGRTKKRKDCHFC